MRCFNNINKSLSYICILTKILLPSSSLLPDSPEVVVPKERPVDNVEQDKTCGEEPPRDSVHQHGFFSSLLHQVANFFLFLGVSVL